MHFSIPDLQQFRDDNGSTYTGFNIYIDGFFHCTARYKQLLSLHEQLQAQYPHFKLPQFPPKKIYLTSSQLDERRILLEKYVQSVGQNTVFANSGILITFLFSAQQETHSVRVHVVDIEISLMNGYRIPLSVSSTDSSSTVLDIACNYVNLSKDFTKYFSLYLFNWSCAKDSQPCMKKLEDYESPYISQKYVRPEDKIVLRKSYWDPCYDIDLMIDRVSLDLLYLQLIEELDLSWMTADAEIKQILSSYEAKKQKREYIELARTLRHYSSIPAGEALTDAVNVGEPNGATIRVRVSLASKELTLASVTHPTHEQRYKVTRMRCWRITTLHNVERSQTNGDDSLLDEPSKNFELSFEYLLSKDNLVWVTLRTEHAIFISVCLQSIVDELMRQKNGEGPTSPRCKRASLTYLRRDGSTHLITPSSSTDTLSSVNGDSSGSSREIFSVQKLTEKFASVAFKTGRDCVENNAFEAIGDEEL
ncbi:sorting nexin-17 [Maniola hyperantus]|uniref:sorting nexin-17 n=1 Tax=Aphantopus hyperantus TaxID=2795564 RepID=UPI00156A5140|nr:sorting nexin-17 [Maniola hyperantus]